MSCTHGLEDISVKMVTLSQLTCRFNTITIEISAAFFAETDKLIIRFIWKCRGPRVAKTVLKKKRKMGGLTFPNFKTYYKAVVIRTGISRVKPPKWSRGRSQSQSPMETNS